MRWPIVITIVAAVSFIFGIISRLMYPAGAGALFRIKPLSYISVAEMLLLFAISIACIIKFKKD
ncbi:hypothetical protein KAW65_02645 [candidate division WOR-3 bacterium]|nr:hypothetical protein [candidate division WOR-3 bacterium]